MQEFLATGQTQPSTGIATLLWQLGVACGPLVIVIALVWISLAYSMRKQQASQADTMKKVDEAVELQKRALRLQEHGLKLEQEQVRLLRMLAQQPADVSDLTFSEENRSAPPTHPPIV